MLRFKKNKKQERKVYIDDNDGTDQLIRNLHRLDLMTNIRNRESTNQYVQPLEMLRDNISQIRSFPSIPEKYKIKSKISSKDIIRSIINDGYFKSSGFLQASLQEQNNVIRYFKNERKK